MEKLVHKYDTAMVAIVNMMVLIKKIPFINRCIVYFDFSDILRLISRILKEGSKAAEEMNRNT